jgi:hypothetical protein
MRQFLGLSCPVQLPRAVHGNSQMWISALLPKKNTMDAVRMELLSHGSKKIDFSIFSDLPVQIRFRTMKEGKILFFKDPLALNRLQAATVREYPDFEPFIRRQCFHAKSAAEGYSRRKNSW